MNHDLLENFERFRQKKLKILMSNPITKSKDVEDQGIRGKNYQSNDFMTMIKPKPPLVENNRPRSQNISRNHSKPDINLIPEHDLVKENYFFEEKSKSPNNILYFKSTLRCKRNYENPTFMKHLSQHNFISSKTKEHIMTKKNEDSISFEQKEFYRELSLEYLNPSPSPNKHLPSKSKVKNRALLLMMHNKIKKGLESSTAQILKEVGANKNFSIRQKDDFHILANNLYQKTKDLAIEARDEKKIDKNFLKQIKNPNANNQKIYNKLTNDDFLKTEQNNDLNSAPKKSETLHKLIQSQSLTRIKELKYAKNILDKNKNKVKEAKSTQENKIKCETGLLKIFDLYKLQKSHEDCSSTDLLARNCSEESKIISKSPSNPVLTSPLNTMKSKNSEISHFKEIAKGSQKINNLRAQRLKRSSKFEMVQEKDYYNHALFSCSPNTKETDENLGKEKERTKQEKKYMNTEGSIPSIKNEWLQSKDKLVRRSDEEFKKYEELIFFGPSSSRCSYVNDIKFDSQNIENNLSIKKHQRFASISFRGDQYSKDSQGTFIIQHQKGLKLDKESIEENFFRL